LDAQAAGASAIVVTSGAADARASLTHPRLRIPVVEHLPPGERAVRVRANLLVHRATYKDLSGDAEIWERTPAPSVAYAFAPIEVRDAESARRAERALFRSLRKAQDGWTSRWLNRYVSLTLSRVLVKTPLRPNQLSLVILAIGLYGAYLATRGDYWSLLAGAALFQAQSILDGCDGEMSRITHRGSVLGEWLDTIGDDVTNYSFFAGAAWGLHTTTGNRLYLLAGLVMLGAGLLASGIEYRYLIRIGSGDLLKYPIAPPKPAGAPSSGLFDAIQPLFKRDTFVFLTLVAAAFGAVGPMLIAFALGAIGVLASVLAAEARMARERRQLAAVSDPKANR
jgi:phosphatidylglycerophosphate synthase